MSHFVRIQLEIREREALLLALEDMGYSPREGPDIPVRGFGARREVAEIVVSTAAGHEIGFRKVGEAYEAVADWWGLERYGGLAQKPFLDALRHRYAYRIVLAQAREQNWLVEEETTLPSGEVVIVLSERG